MAAVHDGELWALHMRDERMVIAHGGQDDMVSAVKVHYTVETAGWGEKIVGVHTYRCVRFQMTLRNQKQMYFVYGTSLLSQSKAVVEPYHFSREH